MKSVKLWHRFYLVELKFKMGRKVQLFGEVELFSYWGFYNSVT